MFPLYDVFSVHYIPIFSYISVYVFPLSSYFCYIYVWHFFHYIPMFPIIYIYIYILYIIYYIYIIYIIYIYIIYIYIIYIYTHLISIFRTSQHFRCRKRPGESSCIKESPESRTWTEMSRRCTTLFFRIFFTRD